MAEHTVLKENQVLMHADVVTICQALKKHQLRLLSLRECKLEEPDLQRILKLAGSCSSLRQLTLSVGLVTIPRHVRFLTSCVARNQALTGLHIHGSCLGDEGIQLLGKSLVAHPNIVSLDIGDCQLGDAAVDVLYDLLLPETNRPSLEELLLSANPQITTQGWACLSMAVANCTSLRMLMLDYNNLGDYGASCFLVAVAAAQSLEILDLEGCGLTEHTGQLILHMVQNHLGGLSKIVLKGNKLKKSTADAIKMYLRENHLDSGSETTTTSSELDVTVSSITSETLTESSSSTQNSQAGNQSPSSSDSEQTKEESEDEDNGSTSKNSPTEEYMKALAEKEGSNGEQGGKDKDNDDDSLGEELTEVPVFYT